MNLSPEQRFKAMAANRGRTKPELRLARSLWAQGLRYLTAEGFKKRYKQKLPGSPDIVFPKARLAVFVDGCFWHGCPLHYTKPQGNSRSFWERKLEQTLQRDVRNNQALEALGWRVRRIWEHEVNHALPELVLEVCSSLDANPGPNRAAASAEDCLAVASAERIDRRSQ